VLFRANTLNGNGDGSEGYGVHLDPNSDNNHLVDNVAKQNETRNLFNEGSGNCGSGNSFPISAC
jgi:hypothetical protein